MEVHYSSKTEEWETPQEFFNILDREFNFTLDPSCTIESAKCKKFYTKVENGLIQSWKNERVFCNPPYGRSIALWIEKMASKEADIAVGLLPARTDTRWFHDFIYGKAEVRFIRGRLKFGGSKHNAPFPSMVAIWRK